MSHPSNAPPLAALVLAVWTSAAVAEPGVDPSPVPSEPGPAVLKSDALRNYVDAFNGRDHTHFGQAISNEATADWMARSRLKVWKNGTWDPGKGGVERGKDYNHSSYCDLIITGLVGLRPRADDTVEVNPLLPDGTWDYFYLDGVPYHGRMLTILYDRTVKQYGKGNGLRILADGKVIRMFGTVRRLTAPLPSR